MRCSKVCRSSAVVSVALCAVAAASAQQTSTADVKADVVVTASPIQTVEITGSAASYDPRRDDTASKIVVGHDELIKYGDTSIVEALKRVPGVTVVSTGRGSDVQMRGLGAGYTQILLNGERAPWGFSFDSLSPAQVERVEVLRSASAEFSTESIAGTINIVLKRMVKKSQREVQLGAGVDRADKTARTNLQLSDRDGNFSYSVSGSTRNTRIDREAPFVDEGFDSEGRPVMLRRTTSDESVHFDVFNVVPRFSWVLGNGDTVSSENYFNFNRSRFRADQASTTALGSAPKYSRMDWQVDVDNLLLKSDLLFSRKLGDGGKLEMKVGLQLVEADNDSHRLGHAAARSALIFDSKVSARTRDHGYSSTGKYYAPFGEGHALTFGWEGGVLARAEVREQRERLRTGSVPANSDETFDADVAKLALFGQDEWTVSSQWSIYLGARWEGIRTSTAGDTFDGATTRSRVWSPIAQTLYKLPHSAGDQLRFAMTRTYKAPEVGDLIPRRRIVENNSATYPDTQGSPLLKPELAVGVDASYEHYWGKGALFSISASSRHIDNYINNLVQLTADGRWVAMPVNDGKAKTHTLEFELKFPLQTLLAEAPALEVRGSLSRNWSAVEAVPGPDNRIAQQTPLSATLAIDHAAGALTTGGSFVYRNGGLSRQSAMQSSYASVRRSLDMYAVWKFDAKNQARLFFGNLLRQDIVSANLYRDSDGKLKRTAFARGYPNLRILVETKF